MKMMIFRVDVTMDNFYRQCRGRGMMATRVTLIIMVVLFGIGVLAEKNDKVAYRLLAGLAICVAGLVVLQIFR